jgi:hypothetical protein
MAKAKKRGATRKKAAKGKKAKPARKKAIKRAAPKKKSRKPAAKVTAKKALKKAPKKAPRPRKPIVEDTIVDVIDEPVPGVIRVTEYEAITTTNPTPGSDTDED